MTDPTQDPDKSDSTPDTTDKDWADALAEQSKQTGEAGQFTQADGLQQSTDDWASALAEQTAATAASATRTSTSSASGASAQGDTPGSPAESTPKAAQDVFQPLIDSVADGNSDIDLIMDIPVQLSVELGRTTLTIKNILQLGQGSVVELDGLAGEPMDIFVNGYLIAQGEVVVVDDKYGVRLTDIITPSDRLNRLNSRR